MNKSQIHHSVLVGEGIASVGEGVDSVGEGVALVGAGVDSVGAGVAAVGEEVAFVGAGLALVGALVGGSVGNTPEPQQTSSMSLADALSDSSSSHAALLYDPLQHPHFSTSPAFPN
jgi:hypothetical protein